MSQLADEIELRPPRLDEAAAVAELANVNARHLWGTDDMTEAELVTDWTAPGVEVERDAIVAVLPGDRLVGYGAMYDVAREHTQFWQFVRIDSSYPDLAPALFRLLEDRVRGLALPGAVLRTSAAAHEDDRQALLTDELAYRRVRHAFRMEIDLHEEPTEPVWPDGIGVRHYNSDRDARAAYEADMEAFEGHWGFQREPFEDWLHWTEQPPFDPTLYFLAFEGEEIAGFSMCPPHKEGEPDLAWVGNLGVRPAWRRRGLALALLRHSFREFRARGFRRAGLGVDGENTTGAVRLYERAGMGVARRWDQFEKALDV